MNNTSKLDSKQKRATLKRITAAGLGATGVASVSLAGGWIRPVVDQVMLPAHAQTTEEPPVVTAVLGNCSSGAPIDITISSPSGTAYNILAVPTIEATPTTVAHASGDWKTVTGGPVPAEITDTAVYGALTRGQMMSEVVCQIPATAVPNSNPEPLTKLDVTFEYQSVNTGVIESLTVDILTLI